MSAALGLMLLAALWLGPLPGLVREGSHAAHMLLHMGVVAFAVPLLCLGLFRRAPPWLAARAPGVMAATTLIDFAVVWAWHAPGLQAAARESGAVLALEQATFALAAALVWLPAVAGPAFAGAAALFMTAMHMTLLGVLIALAPRALHAGHEAGIWGLDALRDQQLGGIVMLVLAGGVYGGAGLWLAAKGLDRREARA